MTANIFICCRAVKSDDRGIAITLVIWPQSAFLCSVIVSQSMYTVYSR